MTDCPAPPQLRRLLNAELSPDVERDVSAHLETCVRCQQVLEELTAVDAIVRPPTSSGSAARVSNSQLQRLRGLLPPGSAHPSTDGPALAAAATWPAVPGYEVLRELGRGGMAVVYEARQLRLNRLVALKMIRAGELATPEQLVRFCAEGEIVAGLRHPHIVQIYEVGSHDGRPYLALELMEGGNLRDALGGLPLPARAAAELVATLAGATEYAHQQGVVHRDLNPSNVLLVSGGGVRGEGSTDTTDHSLLPTHQVKITDFGLAKHLGQDSRLTQTGLVMGTPGYMAPEQVQGQNDRVGPATDVYALGAILYEWLTGRPPFLAATPLETMRQVADLDPVTPAQLLPQLPRDLEVICLKCLEKEPPRRYASARELADDLRRFLNGEPIRARRIHTLERAWRWAKRRPAVAGLLLALAAALLAGAVVSTYFAAEAAHRADLAQDKEKEATEARDAARAAQAQSAQQSAELLLDRGLKLAGEGKVAEALPWMLASLQAATDPGFRRLVRTHLASWGARVPTLAHWLATPVWHTAFSPDGKRLVTAGKPGPGAGKGKISLRFWDVRTGQPLGDPVPTGDFGVGPLAFSPDGRTLLAANGAIPKYQHHPGWVTCWDVSRRRPVARIRGHKYCVRCAGWTPDGKRFLTGSWDGTVCVWDAASGRPVGRPLAHPDMVESLALSPDSRWVLTRAGETAHLWEIATGRRVSAPIQPGEGKVQSVAFSADGQTLLVGGRRPGEKGYWLLSQRFDPGAGRLLGRPRLTPHPTGEISILPDGRVAPWPDASPDGHWFPQSTEGVQLWRLARDRSRPVEDQGPPHPAGQEAARPFLPARFSPAASRVWVSLSGTDRAAAWDTSTGRPTGVVVPHVPAFGVLTRLAASADGQLVATSLPQADQGLSEAVQVWQAGTGRPVGPRLLHPNRVLALAFSPDGKVLASGGDCQRVYLWDVATGQPVGRPLNQHDIILDLTFSPDGATLAVGTCGREVRLWDVARQGPRLPPLKHDDQVARVRFSPDGTRLAALGRSAVYLWDAGTGQRLAILKFDKPGVEERFRTDLHLLFSPNGEVLLTSSGSSSFRLWSAATGQPLGPPTALGDVQQSCFAFSPDSRLVVAGHEDGTAQVWDAATAHPLGAPAVQPVGVTGVAFAADGRSFLTVAVDGTIRSWPVPIPLEGDDRRISLSVQLSTGLRLDEGRAVVPLTRAEWEELRRRWRQRAGDADWTISPPVSEEEWHDARTHDAEETGHAFTARWHLDRLIAARPEDGRLYLRRARTYTDERRWQEAAADYRRARGHEPAKDVLAWYRHRAWACQARGQWSAARWYLDRLLAAQPDDRDLRRQQADVSARLAPQ